MIFELPNLPFSKDALMPHMSAETLDYHYAKHHKAYVDNLNKLIPGTEFENLKLEEIIKKSSGPIFNNAAQVWNHTFFWNSLSPQGGEPSKAFTEVIEKDFTSVEKFKEQFSEAAVKHFASGWTWLVKDPQSHQLSIRTTANAQTPLTEGLIPLLTCDVWEHAYYIDYRNRRADFLASFWKLANWGFAEKNYGNK